MYRYKIPMVLRWSHSQSTGHFSNYTPIKDMNLYLNCREYHPRERERLPPLSPRSSLYPNHEEDVDAAESEERERGHDLAINRNEAKLLV